MIISGEALAEGTIAGVAAAIVLSLWTEGSNFIKTALLSRRVKNSISNFGVGNGIRGVSISVHNVTSTPILLRDALIISDTGNFGLNPEKEIKNIWNEDAAKFEGMMETLISNPQSVAPSSNVFPEVPPYSSRTFLLDAKLAIIPFVPKGVVFIIEHQAFPSGSKIVKVESPAVVNNLLKHSVAHFKTEFDNGNLNNVRAKFGLPPIQKIPMSK
jgi:hypothetical protein